MPGMSGEGRDTGLPRASVTDYPLAVAPTPHYLQRFTYQHAGRRQVFDDGAMASLLPEEERKRQIKRLERLGAQARQASYNKRRGGPDTDDADESAALFPAPKRHNVLTVAVNNGSSAGIRAGPLGSSLVSPAVIPQPPPVTPLENRSQSTEHLQQHLHLQQQQQQQQLQLHLQQEQQQEQHMRVDEDEDDEPSLLSPNASPRPEGLSIERTTSNHHVDDDVDMPESELVRVAGSISTINEAFEQLPVALHRYQIFSLLRGCSRETLSTIYSELQEALRCDLLSLLPPELADIVVGYLDAKSLCAASQVCRSWYRLIEGNLNVWKEVLDHDDMTPTSEDLNRAQREKWGYVGWTTEGVKNPEWPLNALGMRVNMYKAIYRRRTVIANNWMNPQLKPVQFAIACPDREVITCLDLSEDLIIASTDGRKHINVFDTMTGALLQQFTDHDGGVWALKRIGNDTLVSGSVDHTVRVWSLSKGRCTQVLRGHSATVRCLDVVMPVESRDPITNRIVRVPEHPVIITGSRDTSLRMWRLPQAGDPEWDEPEPADPDADPFFMRALHGHTQSVRAVNGWGDIAVSGSYDHSVRVWRISTGQCIHVLTGHTQNVYSVIIDHERSRCISASMDCKINIWSLDTGALLHSLDGHTALVGLLRLCSPSLVSAAADKTLRIWDPESGVLRHKLVGHDTAITCFHHDRRRVVSGSERHLKLWNAESGEFIRNLLDNMDHIWQVSFSHRRCVAAVSYGRASFIEVLDFDFDPTTRSASI